MSKPTRLLVEFREPGGARLGGLAHVRLTTGGKTQAYADPLPVFSGFYFDLSAVGNGTISFQLANHHEYEFRVEVVDDGSGFTLNFDVQQDGMIAEPKMGNLMKVNAASGGKTDAEEILTFTLGACREIVIVAGYDYEHGVSGLFRQCALTRMHDIANEKVTLDHFDDSTVITLFDMETGFKSRWVIGKGSEKGSRLSEGATWSGGWCRLSNDLQGKAPDLKGPGHDPGPQAISITDVYRHIDGIGTKRPGTLEEFSIFSHSYMNGPILFDTDERPEFGEDTKGPDGTVLTWSIDKERDPLDHDARAKDFNPLNLAKIPQFPAAFSPSGYGQVWGCNATERYTNMIMQASKSKTENADLGVWPFPPQKNVPSGPIVPQKPAALPNTRIGAVKFLKGRQYWNHFMGRMSLAIDRPVFGAPPGLGADVVASNDQKWRWMIIPEGSTTVKDGYVLKHSSGNYFPHLQFLKDRKFPKEKYFADTSIGESFLVGVAWEFSTENYIKYIVKKK